MSTRILPAVENKEYCNGYTYGKEVWLPMEVDATPWVLMTAEEAEQLIAQVKEQERLLQEVK